MSDSQKSQELANEKKGWKGLLIAFILSAFFLGFFYLAVTNEPDYMPSQKNKLHSTEQHAAPATHEHDGMQMSDEEMKNMPHDEHAEKHNH